MMFGSGKKNRQKVDYVKGAIHFYRGAKNFYLSLMAILAAVNVIYNLAKFTIKGFLTSLIVFFLVLFFVGRLSDDPKEEDEEDDDPLLAEADRRIRELEQAAEEERIESPKSLIIKSRTSDEEPEIVPSPKEESSGNMDYVPKGVNCLFIADTHGRLSETLKHAVSMQNYDVIILLGDHDAYELKQIRNLSNAKIYGITGNHDEKTLYDELSFVEDISNRVVTICGIKVAAIAGSLRYKDNPSKAMYMPDEYREIIDSLPAADICISHAPAYSESYDEYITAHTPVFEIYEYLKKNAIPLHIYGHLHEPSKTVLPNGTTSICVYQHLLMTI